MLTALLLGGEEGETSFPVSPDEPCQYFLIYFSISCESFIK